MECRLLFRNPLFASLPAVYAVLFTIMMLSEGVDHNLYTIAYRFHTIGHTMTLGPAMLIGILSIRRDVLSRSFEWNHSLPVSFLTMLSSKYAVNLLYLSLFTIPTALIFYTISVSHGIDGGVAMDYAMRFAVQYQVSYMVTLALAMLLGASIPNRIVYLIGFCAWMFGTFFMEIFIIYQLRWFPAEVLHLNQFFFQLGALDQENWNYALRLEDDRRSRPFVLAFTLLLLGVTLLLLSRKRPTMHAKSVWAAVVAAVVLAGAMLVPYADLWRDRYAQTDGKRYNRPVVPSDITMASSKRMFTISAYDLELKRLPNDELHMIARLTIPAAELVGMSELPLTLNRFFDLERVRVQGSDADYRRQWEQLTVMLPDGIREDIEVELAYEGKVMDFRPDFTTYQFAAFSIGEEVKLEGHMAWYPLPGHQDVYLREGSARPNIISLARDYGVQRFSIGDMKLTVEGYPNTLYSSLKEVERRPGHQVFEGKGIGQNVSLFGGRDWIEVRRPDLPLKVVTTPYMERSAKDTLNELKEKYDYFAAWFPQIPNEIDTFLYLGQGIDRPRAEHAIVLSSFQYGGYMPGEWMNDLLFGGQSGYFFEYEHPERDVRDKITSLFWYVYYVEEKGLSDEQLRGAYAYLRSVQQLLFKNGEGSGDLQNRIGIGMARQVRRALEEGKSKQVKELLMQYYEQGLRFPDTERYPGLKPEAPVPYEEWQKRWKLAIGE